MADPGLAVTDYISTNVVALTKGTNLFASSLRAVDANTPINSVFVHGAPGISPDRIMGQSFEIRYPQVFIIVRDAKFGDGNTLAMSILNTLRGATISGYLDIRSEQSEPQNLGQQTDGNHLWQMNFELVYNQP